MRPDWVNRRNFFAPVPEDDEVVAEAGAAAAALGVVFDVGDDLANLAGLGGVAGGVAAVFGAGSGLALGLASAAFALSSLNVGFFVVAGGICLQDFDSTLRYA